MNFRYSFNSFVPLESKPVVQTASVRYQQALKFHQEGRLEEARAIYYLVLKDDPRHADSLHLLGVMCFQKRNFVESLALINQAIAINSKNATYYLNRGNSENELGQLDAAISSYTQAIFIQPAFVEATFNRGLALSRQEKYAESIVSFNRVIELNPDYAAAYSDRGMSLIGLKEYNAAIKSFDMAIAINPNFYDALLNRGIALQALNRLGDALASYNAATGVTKQSSEAYLNRGVALKHLGNIEEALLSYDRAIAIRPDYAKAYFNRGIAMEELRNLDEAVIAFKRVIFIEPGYVEAHSNLGNIFLELGHLDEAIPSYVNAVRMRESNETKSGFANCLRSIAFTTTSPDERRLVARAISEAWIRPDELLIPALSLLNLSNVIKDCVFRAANNWPKRLGRFELFDHSGLTAIADDELLCIVLSSFSCANVQLEQFLTLTRHVMLEMALEQDSVHPGGAPNVDEKVLNLACCLAHQCFINQYVFSTTDVELVNVELLRERLSVRLDSNVPIPPLSLAVIASYAPLFALRNADALLGQRWPESILQLINRQILEPKSELACRHNIPRLSAIDEGVSRQVQLQYEENPYPRWVKSATTIRAVAFESFLRQQFPLAPIEACCQPDSLDVLIAGCGTGQHPIETAQEFSGANVLAIDLSLSSLCYARRKTEELSLHNIEYAQADITQLATLERRFDLIESVGVLHHMADPVAGWKVLVGLLKPKGFMRLGFYSELARKEVVIARQYISDQGYKGIPADIRRCRQELIHGNIAPKFTTLLSSPDFFGTSECRDLLFHVQEHRYTVLQLKDILSDLSLRFLGFSVSQDISRQYLTQFPGDRQKCSLDNWHVFETANPRTFAGMYQFWVQKVK